MGKFGISKNKTDSKEAYIEKEAYNEQDLGLRFRYQPVYMPREERVFGYECLLRIVDPQFGELSPCDFLDAAKRHPLLMMQLEDWAIQALVKAANELKQRKMRFEMLSVNIDSASLFDERFIDRMVRLLGDGYDYDNVWFEFKTDVFAERRREAVENLTDLRALGIKVVIDSFHEDLTTLENLPADMLKLSREYVSAFLSDRAAERSILRMLAYAKMHGFDVAAMGVENARQEKRLMAMGCEKMQGFYYCKPLLLKQTHSKPGGKL